MSNATITTQLAQEAAIAYQTAHYGDDLSTRLYAIWTINLLVVVISVTGRIYAQSTIGKAFSLDSWLICTAALLAVGTNACVIIATRHGLGKHQLRVVQTDLNPPQNFIMIFKMGYSTYLLQTLVLMFTKLSILAFYRRVFTVRLAVFRWAIDGTALFSTLAGIATFIVFVFQCVPVQLFWLRCYLVLPIPPPVSLDGHCMSPTIHVVVPLFFDLASEVAILILPVIGIWNLQLRMRKKVGLLFAFSLGIFVTAISIIRLVYAFPVNIGLDMTWDDVNIFVWTAVQVSFGISCACVPAMAPLYRLFKKSKPGSYFSTHREPRVPRSIISSVSKPNDISFGYDSPKKQTGDSESTKGLNSPPENKLHVRSQDDWGYETSFRNTITAGPMRGYTKQEENIQLKEIKITKDISVEGRNR
ncbi:hypothetical protein BGZ60DRAFT_486923 [Tricladium varicosporioides]|nr:hypothetical protein BGZ60DRAFT_486923 [Hymenoscyphus varicosporioides]